MHTVNKFEGLDCVITEISCVIQQMLTTNYKK